MSQSPPRDQPPSSPRQPPLLHPAREWLEEDDDEDMDYDPEEDNDPDDDMTEEEVHDELPFGTSCPTRSIDHTDDAVFGPTDSDLGIDDDIQVEFTMQGADGNENDPDERPGRGMSRSLLPKTIRD